MSCPRCHTINPSYVSSCFMCGVALGGSAAPVSVPGPPYVDARPTARAPGRTSELAIAGFALSVFGLPALLFSVLFAIPVLVAGILSIQGLRAIRSSQGTLHGRGLAVAGIVMSSASMLVLLLAVARLAIGR